MFQIEVNFGKTPIKQLIINLKVTTNHISLSGSCVSSEHKRLHKIHHYAHSSTQAITFSNPNSSMKLMVYGIEVRRMSKEDTQLDSRALHPNTSNTTNFLF